MSPISAALLALLAFSAPVRDAARAPHAAVPHVAPFTQPAALSKPPTRDSDRDESDDCTCQAACDACLEAARSDDVAGAAKHVASCRGRRKAACISTAKAVAPRVARAAAFNGDCPRARAVTKAARAMGSGSRKLDKALQHTRCE